MGSPDVGHLLSVELGLLWPFLRILGEIAAAEPWIPWISKLASAVEVICLSRHLGLLDVAGALALTDGGSRRRDWNDG